MEIQKISVFGLGKLGCTMLACFAEKGWSVVGVDIVPSVVDAVKIGKSPIYEPFVNELIQKNSRRIFATLNPAEAIAETQATFVIVPTPSLDDGSFSVKYVEAAAAEIGSLLRSKKDYHLVVITSTVLPGDMKTIENLLEKTSGKQVGRDFGLCYNPDFIALGRIVHDFLNPDMILIGESDKTAGDLLESIHTKLVDSKPSIHRMSFHNAELTKIALNSYCTLKITFANTLAEICERMPGGDAIAVTKALGADSRIGSKYIKGGLAYGGPCFPRDNRAFAHSAERFGVTAPLAETTDRLNEYQRNERLPNLVKSVLKEQGANTLAVLGITYKADTQLIEEAAPVYLVQALVKAGISVKIYDPAGMDQARNLFANQPLVQFTESVEACLAGINTCFIGAPWKEFEKISVNFLQSCMAKSPNKGQTSIIDGWGLPNLKSQDIKWFNYIEIGKRV